MLRIPLCLDFFLKPREAAMTQLLQPKCYNMNCHSMSFCYSSLRRSYSILHLLASTKAFKGADFHHSSSVWVLRIWTQDSNRTNNELDICSQKFKRILGFKLDELDSLFKLPLHLTSSKWISPEKLCLLHNTDECSSCVMCISTLIQSKRKLSRLRLLNTTQCQLNFNGSEC